MLRPALKQEEQGAAERWMHLRNKRKISYCLNGMSTFPTGFKKKQRYPFSSQLEECKRLHDFLPNVIIGGLTKHRKGSLFFPSESLKTHTNYKTLNWCILG